MGMTIAHKILALHANVENVQPGDIVEVSPDITVVIDQQFTSSQSWPIPNRINDPEKLAIILDHNVPAPTISDAAGHRKAREFAEKFGIERFYDVGRHGICHQVILEQGLVLPGQILACSDSHTIGSGVFNCLARGLGAPEILQLVCKGTTWFRASPTVKFILEGELPIGVAAKDLFLHIAGTVGSVEGHDVEFGGAGLATLGMEDRSTLATMCAEISADFATFPADNILREYLASIGKGIGTPVESDPDAQYAAIHSINMSELEPFVGLPGSLPNNIAALSTIRGVKINQAFVGSCANGKLRDLREAADVVRGKQVAPGVRFIVTPGSQAVYLEAVRRGYVETLVEAGALVTNATCGACFGGGMGLLAAGEVCISSSTRNFKGRMGSGDAEIYLASSATVAASAVAGVICAADPAVSQSPQNPRALRVRGVES